MFTRVHSKAVLDPLCTSIVTNFASNNVSMPRKHNTMSDVEPTSSESEHSDVDSGEKPARSVGALETTVKRPAGPLASPMAADICFDAAGGAYTRRRAPVRSGVVTATPKVPNGVKGRVGCHDKTRKSFNTRNVGYATTSMCLKPGVV